MNTWISVKDRLPVEEGYYRAIVNNRVDVLDVVCTLEFTSGEFVDGIGLPPVTHWKPLPEPSK